MDDRVARMVAEAEERIEDATILGKSLQCQSDSQSLLKILALEVLLKAIQLQTTGSIARTHRYLDIWGGLSEQTRVLVLQSARERYPGHADLSKPEKLLCVYEWLFTRARYGYEAYEDISLAEQAELGAHWRSRRAQSAEADFQYFPDELSALLHGLVQVVRGEASSPSSPSVP